MEEVHGRLWRGAVTSDVLDDGDQPGMLAPAWHQPVFLLFSNMLSWIPLCVMNYIQNTLLMPRTWSLRAVWLVQLKGMTEVIYIYWDVCCSRRHMDWMANSRVGNAIQHIKPCLLVYLRWGLVEISFEHSRVCPFSQCKNNFKLNLIPTIPPLPSTCNYSTHPFSHKMHISSVQKISGNEAGWQICEPMTENVNSHEKHHYWWARTVV